MKPQVSILIPTRNRRSRLLRTLESLRQQNTGPDVFEVLVVSDGSTDSTKAAVERLASGAEWSGRRLVCVEQDWKGAAAARNTALQMAAGDIVLFLDDDVVADPNLVTAHLNSHKAGRTAGDARGLVVLGDILPDERPEAMHRQMRLWWLDHYRRLAAGKPTFAAFFTGNVSIEREAALTAGGFNESLDYGEDVEFGYRLSLLGLQFKYEPRAHASTMNVKSGAALLRDLHRSGQGSAHIDHKFPATLRDLPLSAYGETNLRMLLSRGLLLNLSRNRLIERTIDKAFTVWAESKMPTRLDRQMFELARIYYFWTGVREEVESRE
jgi:glycosyltransferase involved in cell wall biosynthesis